MTKSRVAAIPDSWRILITGVSSIHGWPVYKTVMKIVGSHQVFALRPPKMVLPDEPNVKSGCITNRNLLMSIKEAFKPTHVIHGAGVCDLDVCEERPDWANRLNVGGASAIADIFGDDCYVMFLSTDLVYSGVNPPEGGYAEHHKTDPVSVAGKSFRAAEKEILRCKRHLIVRLSLPLGDSVTGSKGAIDWIENRFKKSLQVTLFHDEWRSCMTCDEIGEKTAKLLSIEAEGLLHFGGPKAVSLHDIGRMVIDKGDYPKRLLTTMSRHEEINGPPRIGDVSLNSEKLEKLILKIDS